MNVSSICGSRSGQRCSHSALKLSLLPRESCAKGNKSKTASTREVHTDTIALIMSATSSSLCVSATFSGASDVSESSRASSSRCSSGSANKPENIWHNAARQSGSRFEGSSPRAAGRCRSVSTAEMLSHRVDVSPQHSSSRTSLAQRPRSGSVASAVSCTKLINASAISAEPSRQNAGLSFAAEDCERKIIAWSPPQLSRLVPGRPLPVSDFHVRGTS